jgi:hypothetical protein
MVDANMMAGAPDARLTELIGLLEAAEGPDLKLDTMLAYAVADADVRSTTLREVVVEGGLGWETAGAVLDDRPSGFTRSLDAALPGENIVLAVYSAPRGRWAAVHRDTTGREHLAWGATEPLVRRAAALKGLMASDGAVAATDADSAARALGGTSVIANVADANVMADEGEWQIRF